MKKFLYTVLAIAISFNLWVVITGNYYIYPALRYNFAKIDNYDIFENREIKHQPNSQKWAISTKYNSTPLSDTLSTTLKELESIAFLVIKNDSIIIENYWDEYSDSSLSNSFSMAKSYVATLIGFAIDDGYITSVEQKVADFIPSFKKGNKANISIKNILQMSSGLNWEESYQGPFSMTTKAYYGNNIDTLINSLESVEEPNLAFKYLSGNTQVLAMVLASATQKNISNYLSEKMWIPMGYQNDALWCLDKKDGREKAYCCINSNARDFARVGKLYINEGVWGEDKLLNANFIKAATTNAVYKNGAFNDYGYQWWLYNHEGLKVFYARGILGQYTIIIPEKELIIVRLGHKRGNKINNHPEELSLYISEAIKMTE